jgi:nucleotide-binding universal stress UspA family protein
MLLSPYQEVPDACSYHRVAGARRATASASGANPPADGIVTRALIAVDGSVPSIDAARRAAELLGPATAFTLLHVLEPPVPCLGGGVSDRALYQQLLDRAEDLSHRALAAAAAAVEWESRCLRARGIDPGTVICKVAAEEDVDVVVVGSRGVGGLRRARIGSTSLHVVKNAGCPVLVAGDAAADDRR